MDCAFPSQKMTFIRRQNFFQSFVNQNFYFIAHDILILITFWVKLLLLWFFSFSTSFYQFAPHCSWSHMHSRIRLKAKFFCNSKLLFYGFFLLFLRRMASSFGGVLRFLPHLPLLLVTTDSVSACCRIVRDTDFWLTPTILAMVLCV